MNKSDHPSLDLMIIVLILAVVGMGAFACFFKPAYPEGFSIVLQTFVNVLMTVVGAKYALTQTKPIPGTTTHTVTPPDPVAPPTARIPSQEPGTRLEPPATIPAVRATEP